MFEMALSAFLIIFFIIFIVIFLIKIAFFPSRAEQMLSKLPSPSRKRILGTYKALKVKREDRYKNLLKILSQFPESPLVNLWVANKPRVLITKAEAAEVLLKSSVHIVKGDTYNLLKDWIQNGIIIASGSHWTHRRRMISPTFHFKILENFRDIMNEQAEVLVSKLSEIKDQQLDIYNYLTCCILDIMCESILGAKLGSQVGEADEYLKALQGMAQIFTQRVHNYWLRYDFIFRNLSKSGKLQKRYLSILQGFSRKVINERKANFKDAINLNNKNENEVLGKKRRLAFLDMLLDAQKESNAIDDDGIQEEVDGFLFAGLDSTAAATGWVLWNLGRYPKVQEKLSEELESVLGVDDIKVVSLDHINELKYLERVIKETMRIYTTIPAFSRCLTRDVNICGYDIPAGVDVIFAPQLIHNDPNHWPNPNEFDPDRFLPENAANRHPYAYVPFSAGPRNCVGQRFAMNEIKTIVSHVVHRFEIVTTQKPEDMDWLSEFILRPMQGMWIKLENRKRKEN